MGSIGKTSTLLSTTVTTLGTVLTIGDYSFSRGDIEDTAYGTGLWRTFIAGLIDGGINPVHDRAGKNRKRESIPSMVCFHPAHLSHGL